MEAEKKYACPICGRRFNHNPSLKKHLRVHSGDKPYICPFKGCGKRFSQSSNLIRHKRTHTGEKPYCCEFCNKKFASRSNLTQHMEIHKTGQNRLSYSCKLCGKDFWYFSTFKKHFKKDHLEITEKLTKQNFRKYCNYNAEYNEESKNEEEKEESVEESIEENIENNIEQSEHEEPHTVKEELKESIPSSEHKKLPSISTFFGHSNAEDCNCHEKIICNLPYDLSLALPHRDHPHIHNPYCGHLRIVHDGHIDFLHDGELHYVAPDGKVYPHRLAISEKNPEGCNPVKTLEWDSEVPWTTRANFPDLESISEVWSNNFDQSKKKCSTKIPEWQLCPKFCSKECICVGEYEKLLQKIESRSEFFHHHSPVCGHPAIIHGDHIDYIVDGRLHHPHNSHCDDHGSIEILSDSCKND